MNEQNDPMIGRQLGNCVLLRLLGQGGFASVYLAENVHIKTKVAIKVLHTQIAREELERFRDEARTIAELKHPRIVQLLDFGTDADGKTPYLSMSYAPHGSLRGLHRPGEPVALPVVVDHVRQIAEALQFAHNRRIVHRDVKPENVLLNEQNELLLTDFGIALVVQTSHQQSTKDITGTFAYMAPEQTQGKPVAASDQYSLGIMAYEWLAGARPFNGSITELIAQHYMAPPPSLRTQNPAIAPAVEDVIMRALAKKPQDRFASIEAFAFALEQASKGQTGEFRAAENQSFYAAPTLYTPGGSIPPTEAVPERPASGPNFPPTEAAHTWPPQQNITSGRMPQAQPYPSQPRIPSAPMQPMQPIQTPPPGYYVPQPVYSAPPQFVAVPVAPRRNRSCLITMIVLVVILFTSCGGIALTTQLSSMFKKSTPTVNPAYTPVALAPDSNTVYLADWSKGLNHWSGGAEWKWIQSGIIGSDGGQSVQDYGDDSSPTMYLLGAPYRPTNADYEVDAQIQYLHNTGSNGGDFGIVLRVDRGANGYFCGYDGYDERYDIDLMQNGQGSMTSLTSNNSYSDSSDTPGEQYHTYKVTVEKNNIACFVDGKQVARVTDNTYLGAGSIGLRSYSTAIDVHSFRVEKMG